MAREKAKDPRKDASKVRSSKGKDKVLPPADNAPLTELDAEVRRTQLKTLITLGKERGYLTYAEINDHLPDDVVDAEQIESIIATFNNMGIQVFDQAPAPEDLLLSDSAVTTVDEEEAEEEAEQALSSVDSEFGRTTDPVRMYMREMGTVELLTREGEIEIAKRIEDGLKHMVQAISACPTTIAEMLAMADLVAKDEMRIDELVDGLVDEESAEDAAFAASADAEGDGDDSSGEDEDDGEEVDGDGDGGANAASLLQLKTDALSHFDVIRGLFAEQMDALSRNSSQDPAYLSAQQKISEELLRLRFTAKTIERLCDSVRHMVEQVRSHERQILQLCVDRAGMPRNHFIKTFPGKETHIDWLKDEIASGKVYAEGLMRVHPAVLEEQQKLIDLQTRIGIPLRELKDINKQMSTGEAKA
ncbi:MAG: RNA polymerase sigma factor RpoD, partial [Zoogloeaceae bacterium]|nr:RNA polymerase sigma factor RpoD [Zoogloeaceae bacterium]